MLFLALSRDPQLRVVHHLCVQANDFNPYTEGKAYSRVTLQPPFLDMFSRARSARTSQPLFPTVLDERWQAPDYPKASSFS
jgi:hypothetical protein